MTPDPHTFAGAYALDALSDIERRQFEAHLAECDACAQEVRGLGETAARLGTAAAQEPPAGLRERVLAEVERTRQLPPRTPLHRRVTRGGAAWILAAACLVVAVAAGIAAFHFNQRAGQAERLNRAVAAVMAAPDARVVTGHARPGGNGTIVESQSLGKAVVVMSDLPALPADRTYQLWLMGDGTPRSVGTMRPAAGTTAAPVVAAGIVGEKQIGITVEPAGGSPRPTTAPIFTVGI